LRNYKNCLRQYEYQTVTGIDKMWNVKVQKFLQVIFIMTATGYVASSNAHDAAAEMDPNGNVASFTGYAQVTCFDDGNGPADYLEATIEDTSKVLVENLLVNLQLIKGERAISISDPIAGDGNPSPIVILQGGNGVYLILVNKTGAGARSFGVDYHCKTANGTHTGTDIKVNQFQ